MTTIETCMKIVAAFWDILLESSVFILFGFFVAGLLKGYIPNDFIEKHLGGRRKAGIFKASLFGIPIPLCSCGVIPAAAGLRQQKAGKGAVTSFMISTPETGMDSIAVTYALLDPVMTLARPVAAFFTAMVTGLLVNVFDRDQSQQTQQAPPGPGVTLPSVTDTGRQSACGCKEAGCLSHAKKPVTGIWRKLQQGMAFSFGNLLGDIGPWLFLGIGLAALITVFVSPSFIHSYLGSGIVPMLVMIAIATPLYVCATASTPIAAALALKGLSPGAALVFLLAGPATNVATLTVVARLLGRKAAVIYVSSIVVCSLVLGMAVNWLYVGLGLSVADWVHTEHHHAHGFLYTIAAVVLLLLIARPWTVRQYRRMMAVCVS